MFNIFKRKPVSSTIIKKDGTREWYFGTKLHRDNDLPAIEFLNGDKAWFQHGELHRDNDKPAIERVDGYKQWNQRGKIHRDDDNPAIEERDATKRWYVNGVYYRDGDKPVVEKANGDKFWGRGGGDFIIFSRMDKKPAKEYGNGIREWWMNGRKGKAIWQRGEDREDWCKLCFQIDNILNNEKIETQLCHKLKKSVVESGKCPECQNKWILFAVLYLI